MGKVQVRITDKEKGKTYTDLSALAKDLYDEGHHFHIFDIETLAKAYDCDEWYLLDEMGNFIVLYPERFDVEIIS